MRKNLTPRNGKITMKAAQRDPQSGDQPAGLARPAQRALAGAGISRLSQLARLTEAEVRQLHGIGPNALDQLGRALRAKGLSFAAAKKAARRRGRVLR
jgi:hypothetical protein